jgi:hypothetical protein
LPGEVVDRAGVGAGSGRKAAAGSGWAGQGGQACAQEPVVQAGEEQGVREPGVGDLVAEGARDAFDEPVLAKAAQVVGHLPRGDGLGGHAEELRHDGAQVAVGEAAGKKPEDAQGCEQGVDAGITEAHARDAGAGFGGEGAGDLADGGLAVGGIVAEFLDGEQSPGGLEAGGPQGGQVGQPFADAEVAGVVDGPPLG